LLEHAGEKVLNLNDNMPTVEVAAQLTERHGPFQLVLLQYCAAGPYPSCFQNYSRAQMQAACDAAIERYLAYFTSIGRTTHPRYFMPFAGDFVLGGSQSAKNQFLGTTTVDHAVAYASSRLPDVKVVALNEGMTLDTATGELLNGPYRPYDTAGRDRYIAEVLSKRPYPHEADAHDERQLEAFFREAMPICRENLWRWQSRMKGFPQCHIYLRVPSGYFHFDFSKPEHDWVSADAPRQEPALECSMDLRLLRRILRREAHWNNAEGGCHIDFVRHPDNYLPDVHTLLSFFHVPKAPEPAKVAS
jgi:UDP-MurNAc hydroxylase